ncbi:MAG TPA: stage II sporulation protein M [Candidatus Acidoferrales bacterium]|nr:stage II sporulation protein M [Candidatus Acidoferrales bacterium]
MISSRWLRKRRSHWSRLEELVTRTGSFDLPAGVSALTHRELQELGLLYRQTASDLARVRDDPESGSLAEHLNRLLGRAHNLVYSGGRRPRGGVLRFYMATFPQAFRETFSYTLAAFAIFLLGTVLGWLLTLRDPGFGRFFLNPAMADTIEERKMWTDSIVAVKPLASSGIMTNNLTVCFLTFAAGITAGVGTVLMLFENGVLMGVIGAACWQAGLSLRLWSFVAGHGALELPAIFISGGAGLLLARGLLFPGFLPRRDALAEAGRKAVQLVLGIIPVLVLAGIIEGFLSPSPFPAYWKFLLGAAAGSLLTCYLTIAGRGQSAAAGPPAAAH